MPVAWNPWHGCRKTSEGCRNCYVYRQDAQHALDSSEARKTAAFDLPVRRSRNGRFKIPGGEMVYTCFTSDYLLEEADAWRPETWEMMRLRRDLRFMFFTKRIERLRETVPPDWGEGYENVTIGCTVENQEMAGRRLRLSGDADPPPSNRLCTAAGPAGPPAVADACRRRSIGRRRIGPGSPHVRL